MKFLTSRVVVCAIVLGAVFCSTNVRAVVDEDDFSTLTSKAYVDSLINSNDLSEHTINGAELGNQDSYFYGVSETSGNTAAKVVEIDSITDGSGTGLVIVVQPENTHTGTISNGLTLQLNSETAAEILYNGASVTSATAPIVWNGGHPSVFVFDGTNWNFVGTTYDVMGVQEGITATDTTPRTLSAANIKGIVQGTKLTGLTTSNTLVSASDDVLTGIGKLQGQISALPDYGRNMVNGASIRNENSTFYGVSDSGGTEVGKIVRIPSIDELVDGLIIVVLPKDTSTVANSTLDLNGFGAKSMLYNGAPVTAETAPIVWNLHYPSVWVYDKRGGAWVFAGNGHDSTADISNLASHTINGAPLSNSASYFYDPAGGGAAFSWEKTVSIPSITTLEAGQIITVKPSATSRAMQPVGASRPSQMTLTLNADGQNFRPVPVLYNGNAVTGSEQSVVWNAKYPSTFVYDGTNWVFMGRGYDADTKYSVISVQDGIAGTDGTTLHTVRADYLKDIIQGTTLTGLDTTSTVALDASDSITTAIGKLEGQKQSKIPATTSTYVYDQSTNPAADGSVVTTNTLGVTGERGIATAPTYDNNSQLTNGSWLPTVSAVSGMVSAGTPTGTPTYVATYLPHANGDPAGEGKVGGEVAIYDTANTYNASTDADKLATAGFVETKLNKNSMLDTQHLDEELSEFVDTINDNFYVTRELFLLPGADNGSNWAHQAMDYLEDYVPTVEAMATALNGLYDVLHYEATPFAWDSTAHPAAINAYSTTFDLTSTHVAGNWPYQTENKLVDGTVLANSLALKQNKLPALPTGNMAPANIPLGGGMTIALTSTPGVVETRYIAGSGGSSINVGGNLALADYVNGSVSLADYATNSGLTGNQIRQTLVTLETLKDVYEEISDDISDAIEEAAPTGTVGYVATYLPHANGDPAGEGKVGGEVAIYDTANTYNASTDANKLATAGFVATKQDTITPAFIDVPNIDPDLNDEFQVFGMVTPNSTFNGLTSGHIGILDNDTAFGVFTIGNVTGTLLNLNYGTLSSLYPNNTTAVNQLMSDFDHVVPTALAVGEALGELQMAMEPLTWTSTETTAANNYSITFDGETGNWPAADAGKLIDGTALANALSTKQRKITRSPLSFTSSGAVGSSSTYVVPATIATSTKRNANESNEISAQTYGIMDSSTANDAEGGLKGFSTSYYQGQLPNVNRMDKFVPTVRAVALALADVDWDPIVWSNTHETLINAYSTSFAAGLATRNEWAAADADKLVNGTFIANALALKQNIIPVRGTARDTALRIVTYPQYGQSAGAIGELIRDTASLYITDHSHIPSSKLVSELLDLELDKSLAWHADPLDEFFHREIGLEIDTSRLFGLVDLVNDGDPKAEIALTYFKKYDVVPTMEVLAYALNGAYHKTVNALTANIYDTTETTSSINSRNIGIPTALTFTEEYGNDTKLSDTEQLFLVPWVRDNDNGAAGTAAGNLLTSYATNENIPTLDTVANALYGLYKTRKTSDDLFEDTIETSDVVIDRLYELDPLDGNYTSFINSGYMDAFVPTISMLWNESRELYQMIETKQRIIPRAGYYISLNVNPPVQVADWGASAVRGVAIPTKSDSTHDELLGERWIVDSDTNTSGWPAAKLNYAIPAVNWTQQKISASGRYDLNSGHYYNTNAENDAHSWLNSEVKGNGIVTRTSTNGVVGERKIFEQGDIANYHDENLTANQMAIQDISIPTVAAVVEMVGEFSQNKKTCYEYKPGMPETDENCWLWEFQ